MGLILDTSVIVTAERSRRSLVDVLSAFPSHEELGISVVTVAELQHGLRRAESDTQLQRRSRLLQDVLNILKVHLVTVEIAVRMGDLDAELTMRGKKTDIADLMIGATALELGFSLVTSNLRHFERIPDLGIVSL